MSKRNKRTKVTISVSPEEVMERIQKAECTYEAAYLINSKRDKDPQNAKTMLDAYMLLLEYYAAILYKGQIPVGPLEKPTYRSGDGPCNLLRNMRFVRKKVHKYKGILRANS